MQPKTISWGDSVRAWASGYKDSVAVDYDAANMKYVYVHKSLQNDGKNHFLLIIVWVRTIHSFGLYLPSLLYFARL